MVNGFQQVLWLEHSFHHQRNLNQPPNVTTICHSLFPLFKVPHQHDFLPEWWKKEVPNFSSMHSVSLSNFSFILLDNYVSSKFISSLLPQCLSSLQLHGSRYLYKISSRSSLQLVTRLITCCLPHSSFTLLSVQQCVSDYPIVITAGIWLHMSTISSAATVTIQLAVTDSVSSALH